MALELGPCQVKYGTAGAEADLGKTSGGVKLTIKDDSADLVSDQYGTSPEDTVITGTSVEVTLSLAEIDFDTLSKVLQPNDSSPNSAFTTGLNKVGTSLLSVSESLVLVKYDPATGAPSTDLADQIVFPAAAPLGDVELNYDASNQRVLSVTFKCFPKLVTSNWGTATADQDKTVSYYFGDDTVTS